MSDSEQPLIVHAFADHGVESEALATYGRVVRYTIDPEPNEFVDETVQMDLVDNTPDVDADLAVLHPMCTKWSDMPDVDPEDHPDQIPRAREIGREIADHYVIENKPKAPLNDPLVLEGRMFNLPIRYERAFETSFDVNQPPRNARLTEDAETSPFFYTERSSTWWKSVKGIRGDYPPEHIAKNALPLVYIDYVARAWLETTELADGVGDYTDYDARMETQRREEANQSLEVFADE